MRTEIPIGGFTQDYNSRRNRGDITNAFVEFSADGTFSRVRKCAGFSEFANIGVGPIRGLFRIKNRLFVASNNELWLYEIGGTTLLGDIGGYNSLVKFAANGTDDNQIIIISDQRGFLYDDASGFREVTDTDFVADYSVASLNQIFWTNERDSNVFAGSETADGEVWPALRVASAEQSPDPLVYIAQKRSALWLMGTRTCEYWQTDASDVDVPVRPVLGATLERGVGAKYSVAESQDSIFFLADDFTVLQIQGTGYKKISDLSLEYAIKGDGFKEGYANPEDAEGFFIDHPSHKFYVLTFKSAKITWVYDASTGLWHKRKSNGFGYWRARTSQLAFNKVLVGDALTGQIWELDESAYTEAGAPIEVEIVTPAINGEDRDLFVSYIEPNVEVGRAEFTSEVLGVLKGELVPTFLQVEYSKDGGVTYKSKASINLGTTGNRQKVTRSYQFGRTKKGFNFCLKLTYTDNAPFFLYKIYADLDKGG